jgi:hypothetical protein
VQSGGTVLFRAGGALGADWQSDVSLLPPCLSPGLVVRATPLQVCVRLGTGVQGQSCTGGVAAPTCCMCAPADSGETHTTLWRCLSPAAHRHRCSIGRQTCRRQRAQTLFVWEGSLQGIRTNSPFNCGAICAATACLHMLTNCVIGCKSAALLNADSTCSHSGGQQAVGRRHLNLWSRHLLLQHSLLAEQVMLVSFLPGSQPAHMRQTQTQA